MANPRQRRKHRSSSHKPVHHSSRAKKLLRKQKPIRGPKILQEAWQKTKTVRQNYEALGLVASLNPTPSGGMESTTSHLDRDTNSTVLSSTPEVSDLGNSGVGTAQAVPKGFGRIIRDENGNVIDIDLGEENPDDVEDNPNKLIEDIPHPSAQDGAAGWIILGSNERPSSTSIVESLKELSTTNNANTPRFTSSGELKILLRLISKHKQDVGAMARDRKLNVDQRTAGELRRAIQKAGGFSALQCIG